ncbi:MAG: amidohydrolase family protein [Chloroflexi bacterium]|nr:amidohydrolase family protein [Chloroflexota bacterium]
MAAYPIIDADSHVEECEETWAHLEPRYAARRPVIVQAPLGPGVCHQDAFWLVDGRVHPQPFGHGATMLGTPVTSALARKKPFTIGSQTLRDIPQRLVEMDAFGIAAAVLYPTALLVRLTEDPSFEAALMRSYNTWLAERCAQAPDRLKWAAAIPFRAPGEAVEEVQRARQLGASAAMVLGTAGATLLHDEQFDPIYRELVRQDLPLSVHVGWGHPGLQESADGMFASFSLSFSLPVLAGFFSIVGGGVLDRHPDLRVAFLEAGGDWLPWMVQRMDRYRGVTQFHNVEPVSRHPIPEYLRQGNVYLTVEGDEWLLPQVIEVLGEDHVMASADIPHPEGREDCLAEVATRQDLSAAVKEKILSRNPARFYGIALETLAALTPTQRASAAAGR